jgi:hypothetical protein
MEDVKRGLGAWLGSSPGTKLLRARGHDRGNGREKCSDLEFDAGDLFFAFRRSHARALAELGKAQMIVAAQLDAGRDENGVDVDAGMAFEFEQDIHGACIIRSTAQDPTPAAQDAAGQGLHQAAGLFCGDGLHLDCPGHDWRSLKIGDRSDLSHEGFIGMEGDPLTPVREWNGNARL